MNKIKLLIKSNAKEILATAVLVLLIFVVYGYKQYRVLEANINTTSNIQDKAIKNTAKAIKDIKTVAEPKKIKKAIIKTVENKPLSIPKCTPAEINYTLKNTDNLLSNKNWLVLDLDTFKKLKTITKSGKKYVYYQRFGKEDVYITIAKKIK